MSGNYRLGEFQGAVLNAQLGRLEAQTKTRNRNGLYLASRLAKLPGLHPQQRSADCTRHSYHLFMLRLEGTVSRTALLKTLQSAGIPCSAGYGFSLHQQPFFRNRAFGPYLPNASVDYVRTTCPNSDLICREQGVWLEQNLFLGSRNHMDCIARAFEKALGKS
jgi:dTDP-4-amino-4,6-dideoxygalactose transaminase